MDAEMMENIRANARYYRLVKGFSGPYIGKAIGHDATWVQQFEAGVIQKPKPEDLIKLAHALGFQLKDLIKPKPDLLLYISPEEIGQRWKNWKRSGTGEGYQKGGSGYH